MTDIRILDDQLLPTFRSIGLLIEHDQDVKAYLDHGEYLAEVSERANSSLMFFSSSPKCTKIWTSSAYIRAGLNEFYGIEDAAKRDWINCGFGGVPPKIKESVNPLVHLMYLLRHVNVHATISKTKKVTSSFILDDPKERLEFDMDILVLDENTLPQILKSKEALKYYNKCDLDRYSNWLDAQQFEFGISQVFRSGLSSYCREIIQSICA